MHDMHINFVFMFPDRYGPWQTGCDLDLPVLVNTVLYEEFIGFPKGFRFSC
jgi:hypothetical protein